jgi:hypothetical protein
MKTTLKPCLLLLPLLLTACDNGGMREQLGLTRDAPDEFSVVSRPPLSLPPDFTLRPPKPGEPPRGIAPDAQARSLLTGKAPSASPTDVNQLTQPTVDTAVTPVIQSNAMTGGETSILKRAGADKADDSIRDKLNVDAATPRDNSGAKTLLDQIDGKEKNEPVVDAKKEAERIRDNKDEGKPITEGDTPNEQESKKSLIDRIF